MAPKKNPRAKASFTKFSLHDPMSPAIQEPGPSFVPAVSPDLFYGGEDIGPTPTEVSQSFRTRASPLNIKSLCLVFLQGQMYL